eukprot:CAMPEP_0170866176 /NCGR_PEP_ID=MMETSP0734-20130129/21841_1 /TAXON_ID=186038 /ORGANISM="Fragilariopsis kerguelensis, Strain L26-C5" /LENGTH=150 /DNA_ID=CAMNT_0011242773 /DNA_START=35 /DNA_END=488 /DNA_ORIENTATION=+
MISNGNESYESAGRASDNDETNPLGCGEKQRKAEMKKKKGTMSLIKSNISENVLCLIEDLVMEPIFDDDINRTLSFSNDDKMAILLAKMEESNSDIKLLLLVMKKNNELSVEEIKKTSVKLDDTEKELRTNNVKLDTIQKSQKNILMTQN